MLTVPCWLLTEKTTLQQENTSFWLKNTQKSLINVKYLPKLKINPFLFARLIRTSYLCISFHWHLNQCQVIHEIRNCLKIVSTPPISHNGARLDTLHFNIFTLWRMYIISSGWPLAMIFHSQNLILFSIASGNLNLHFYLFCFWCLFWGMGRWVLVGRYHLGWKPFVAPLQNHFPYLIRYKILKFLTVLAIRIR